MRQRLATHALELDVNGVVRKAIWMSTHQLTRQHGPDRSVHISSLLNKVDLLTPFDGRPGLLDEAQVQRLLKAMILTLGVTPAGSI